MAQGNRISLSDDHDDKPKLLKHSNSTSRYLHELLNIDNPYFEGMVNQMSLFVRNSAFCICEKQRRRSASR